VRVGGVMAANERSQWEVDVRFVVAEMTEARAQMARMAPQPAADEKVIVALQQQHRQKDKELEALYATKAQMMEEADELHEQLVAGKDRIAELTRALADMVLLIGGLEIGWSHENHQLIAAAKQVLHPGLTREDGRAWE